MTAEATKKSRKLENEPLWQEANALAEYMYDLLPQLPDEERWETSRKLRSASSDMLFFAAQAFGSVAPSSAEFELANVRKYVSALKTMYLFAARQGFIELEPSIVVRLDKFIEQIDEKHAAELVRIERYEKQQDEKTLRPWLKKIRHLEKD